MTADEARSALATRGLTAVDVEFTKYGNWRVSGVKDTPGGMARWSGCGPTLDAAVTALDDNGPAIEPSKAVVDAAAESELFG